MEAGVMHNADFMHFPNYTTVCSKIISVLNFVMIFHLLTKIYCRKSTETPKTNTLPSKAQLPQHLYIKKIGIKTNPCTRCMFINPILKKRRIEHT